MRKRYLMMFVLGLALLLAVPGIGHSQAPDLPQSYESYFLYLGNHPTEANPGWHEEAQGITHDDDHWFLTQTGTLWKIPVTHDLSSPVCREFVPFPYFTCLEYAPGVFHKTLDDYPELSDYNHFGDLTYYEHQGNGYLVIPLDDDNGPLASVGVFRPNDDLDYVDHALLSQQTGAGWAAIDPNGDGDLYSSQSSTDTLHRYSIEWDTLNETNELIVKHNRDLQIFDETGGVLQLTTMQGGVFSESGRLLYTVSGYLDQHYANDGINVFDTRTWRRVRRSSTSRMPFKYEFHPGWDTYEEPEGITIWDLDGGRAPRIQGTLHVLMLDNDEPFSSDDVYLKHYTEVISVDGDYTGDEEGTPQKPFNTVGEAYDLAWDGQRIRIRAGSYPESVTFSKRLEVLASGGSAVIGR